MLLHHFYPIPSTFIHSQTKKNIIDFLYVQVHPQYPNINFGPSIPPPIVPSGGGASASGPRIGFNFDDTAKPPPPPFHDPFPQVPNTRNMPSPPPPAAASGNDGGTDDSGFDELARRFEDLKKRK